MFLPSLGDGAESEHVVLLRLPEEADGVDFVRGRFITEDAVSETGVFHDVRRED